MSFYPLKLEWQWIFSKCLQKRNVDNLGAEWKRKSATISLSTIAQNWHGNLLSTFSPSYWLFKNRAELLWVWPENKNPRGRRPELTSLAWWCAGVCGCVRVRRWTNLTWEFQDTAQLISCTNSLACFNAACDARPVRCSSEMSLCAVSAVVCTTKCVDLWAFIEVQRCVC